MDVLSKQAKKDIRQLIIIGRDRETAKFLQQVEPKTYEVMDIINKLNTLAQR